MVHARAVVDTLGRLVLLRRNRPGGMVTIADRRRSHRYRVGRDLGCCAGGGIAGTAIAIGLNGILLHGFAEQRNSVSSHRLGTEGD